MDSKLFIIQMVIREPKGRNFKRIHSLSYLNLLSNIEPDQPIMGAHLLDAGGKYLKI